MKFGVAIGNFGLFGKRGTARDQVRVAQAAERLGFDSVWVHDHLVMPLRIHARYPYNESGVAGFAWRQDIYDPLAMMAAVAVATERVEIGTSVLIVPYRNPLALAKMLATIDQLARGRIRLGIGVGWMQEEFEALGIGAWYPERGRVTDEWIAICKELWSGDGPSSFKGEFASFQDVGAFPKPVQGRIPIWVGGWGRAAARRVARLGDGYMTISSTPAMVAEQLATVTATLEQQRRSIDSVEVSMLGGIRIGEAPAGGPAPLIGGSRQQIIDRLGEYQRAGLQHLIGTPFIGAAGAATTPLSTARSGAPPAPGAMTPERLIEALHYLAEEILPALREQPAP